ncbi:hypothetical protein [Actinomadura graeca]|uniref:hypothetical protein n=1 Tax=Actinomadura graeca TaxID=2750812 RepID=UPI001E5C8D58|nr:hypothetical protein [Actinomadura graeca]
MIADAGSRAGTGGTSTSPAPSIPRLDEPLEAVPRPPPREAVRPETPVEPDPAEPEPAEPEPAGPLEAREPPEPLELPEPLEPLEPLEAGTDTGSAAPTPTATAARDVTAPPTDEGTPAGTDGSAGGGSASGIMPQVSQKPSASTVPAQPSCAHRVIAASPSHSRSP